MLVAALASYAPAASAAAQDAPAHERLLRAVKHPYLSVGALLQTVADFQIERSEPGSNGFRIPNFRLSLSGELDRFGYFLQTNFAAASAILDARLHVRPSRATRIDVGQFKVPFSREFLTGAGDLDMVNRARAVTALVPGRQIGLQAGLVGLGGRMELRGGAFNGTPASANDNDNNDLLYALRADGYLLGRASWGSGTSLGIGASVAYSRDSLLALAGGLLPDFDGTRTLVGADVRYTTGAWLASAEIIWAHLEARGGASLEPWGHHVTLGYRHLASVHTLFRWERFDRDDLGEREDLLIGGVNLRPHPFVEVQANYLVRAQDAALDHHEVLVNFELGF